VIRIRSRRRGPLVVDLDEGDGLELKGLDGEVVPLGERRRLMFCRCGSSATPPFCDGTHNRLPFEAPPAPPEPPEE
jgi:CDGSH iron-sulfur domain-containing protein 3